MSSNKKTKPKKNIHQGPIRWINHHLGPFMLLHGATVVIVVIVIVGSGSVCVVLKKRNISKLTNKKTNVKNEPNDG